MDEEEKDITTGKQNLSHANAADEFGTRNEYEPDIYFRPSEEGGPDIAHYNNSGRLVAGEDFWSVRQRDPRNQLSPYTDFDNAYGQYSKDNSVYDSDITDWTRLKEDYSINNLRGREQSGGVQILNGIAKGATTFVTTLADNTIGFFWGIGSSIYHGDSSKFVDNEFTTLMKSVNDAMEELAPNYYTKEEENMGLLEKLSTANFWGNSFIKNIGFTVGAFYSGGLAAAKVPRLLAYTRHLNKILPQLIKGASSTERYGLVRQIGETTAKLKPVVGFTIAPAYAATNEGVIEALNAKKDALTVFSNEAQDRRDQKISDLNKKLGLLDGGFGYDNLSEEKKQEYNKEYNKILGEQKAENIKAQEEGDHIANYTLALNIPILMASNAFQFGKLWGGGYDTAHKMSKGIFRSAQKYKDRIVNAIKNNDKKELRRSLVTPITKGVLKGFSEGKEEVLQKLASTWTTDIYSTHLNNWIASGYDNEAADQSMDIYRSFMKSLSAIAGDQGTAEEFLVGFLTGIMGMPVFGKAQVNQNAYLKLGKFGFAGGLGGEIRDYRRDTKTLYKNFDWMHSHYGQLPELAKTFNRLLAAGNATQSMLAEKDKFGYLQNEFKEAFAAFHIMDMFGIQSVFNETVLNNIDKLDDATLSQIMSDLAYNIGNSVDNTSYDNKSNNTGFSHSQNTKYKSRNGSIKTTPTENGAEYAKSLINDDGSFMTTQQFKERIKKNKDSLIKYMKQYNKARDKVYSDIPDIDERTPESVGELIYLYAAQENMKDRLHDMFESKGTQIDYVKQMLATLKDRRGFLEVLSNKFRDAQKKQLQRNIKRFNAIGQTKDAELLQKKLDAIIKNEEKEKNGNLIEAEKEAQRKAMDEFENDVLDALDYDHSFAALLRGVVMANDDINIFLEQLMANSTSHLMSFDIDQAKKEIEDYVKLDIASTMYEDELADIKIEDAKKHNEEVAKKEEEAKKKALNEKLAKFQNYVSSAKTDINSVKDCIDLYFYGINSFALTPEQSFGVITSDGVKKNRPTAVEHIDNFEKLYKDIVAIQKKIDTNAALSEDNKTNLTNTLASLFKSKLKNNIDEYISYLNSNVPIEAQLRDIIADYLRNKTDNTAVAQPENGGPVLSEPEQAGSEGAAQNNTNQPEQTTPPAEDEEGDDSLSMPGDPEFSKEDQQEISNSLRDNTSDEKLKMNILHITPSELYATRTYGTNLLKKLLKAAFPSETDGLNNDQILSALNQNDSNTEAEKGLKKWIIDNLFGEYDLGNNYYYHFYDTYNAYRVMIDDINKMVNKMESLGFDEDVINNVKKEAAFLDTVSNAFKPVFDFMDNSGAFEYVNKYGMVTGTKLYFGYYKSNDGNKYTEFDDNIPIILVYIKVRDNNGKDKFQCVGALPSIPTEPRSDGKYTHGYDDTVRYIAGVLNDHETDSNSMINVGERGITVYKESLTTSDELMIGQIPYEGEGQPTMITDEHLDLEGDNSEGCIFYCRTNRGILAYKVSKEDGSLSVSSVSNIKIKNDNIISDYQTYVLKKAPKGKKNDDSYMAFPVYISREDSALRTSKPLHDVLFDMKNMSQGSFKSDIQKLRSIVWLNNYKVDERGGNFVLIDNNKNELFNFTNASEDDINNFLKMTGLKYNINFTDESTIKASISNLIRTTALYSPNSLYCVNNWFSINMIDKDGNPIVKPEITTEEETTNESESEDEIPAGLATSAQQIIDNIEDCASKMTIFKGHKVSARQEELDGTITVSIDGADFNDTDDTYSYKTNDGKSIINYTYPKSLNIKDPQVVFDLLSLVGLGLTTFEQLSEAVQEELNKSKETKEVKTPMIQGELAGRKGRAKRPAESTTSKPAVQQQQQPQPVSQTPQVTSFQVGDVFTNKKDNNVFLKVISIYTNEGKTYYKVQNINTKEEKLYSYDIVNSKIGDMYIPKSLSPRQQSANDSTKNC